MSEVPAASDRVNSRKWQCYFCGFIYDETLGLPEEGIAAGTAWADVPEDWMCPDCGVGKSDFYMVEIE
jgi:rubredoxin